MVKIHVFEVQRCDRMDLTRKYISFPELCFLSIIKTICRALVGRLRISVTLEFYSCKMKSNLSYFLGSSKKERRCIKEHAELLVFGV